MTALPGDLVGFTLVNDGPGRISFGFNTRFERYDDGHWIGCYVENAAVPGILISLPEGEREELGVLVPPAAPAGRYRVTHPINASDGNLVELSFELDVAS